MKSWHSFKRSKNNIQKKIGGPDRSVSIINFLLVILNYPACATIFPYWFHILKVLVQQNKNGIYLERSVELVQRRQDELQEQVVHLHLRVCQPVCNSLDSAVLFVSVVMALEVASQGVPLVKQSADALLQRQPPRSAVLDNLQRLCVGELEELFVFFSSLWTERKK